MLDQNPSELITVHAHIPRVFRGIVERLSGRRQGETLERLPRGKVAASAAPCTMPTHIGLAAARQGSTKRMGREDTTGGFDFHGEKTEVKDRNWRRHSRIAGKDRSAAPV